MSPRSRRVTRPRGPADGLLDQILAAGPDVPELRRRRRGPLDWEDFAPEDNNPFDGELAGPFWERTAYQRLRAWQLTVIATAARPAPEPLPAGWSRRRRTHAGLTPRPDNPLIWCNAPPALAPWAGSSTLVPS